jgi:hypothetical protein
MAPRLYDLGDRQMLRVVGLQVRGYQAYAPFEDFQGDSRLDPGALDPATDRYTMVTV